MFVIEIEETQNNPRAGWDDYRPAYYAVAYQFDATSPLIRCPVYIWRHSYVLAEVEVVAQQLRDLYDAPGSQLDHFQVTRTGNRIFLMIHRKDGTQYAFLDAQAVTNTDLTTFAAKLRQFALVTSADEYSCSRSCRV